MWHRSTSPSPSLTLPLPIPVPPPASEGASRQATASPAEEGPTCRGCGTSVPANEPLCPICLRVQAPATGTDWTTLRNWLVMLLALAVILGAGVWLAPA